jgi:hypothetical protein
MVDCIVAAACTQQIVTAEWWLIFILMILIGSYHACVYESLVEHQMSFAVL